MTTPHPVPSETPHEAPHEAPQGDRSDASPLREVALGVIFLAVGVAVLLLARSIELPPRALAVSPRIWPEALGIGIIGLSVLQIVVSFIPTARGGRAAPQDDDLEPATRVGVLRVVGFVAATLAFGLLWYYVHFLISGMLFVAALTWIAGGRGIRDLILFPAGITVVLYALFALLLRVPL